MRLILATDLDGTFIPLDGAANNQTDLQTLTRQIRARDIVLTFVTGRHLESVLDAVVQYRLPDPDWLICDVGTSLYCRRQDGRLHQVPEYADELRQLSKSVSVDNLCDALSECSLLRLQEDEKQGRFKLSYYTERDELPQAVGVVNDTLTSLSAPYSMIHSVDPFTGDGLIDLVPRGVSKAFALRWWTSFTGHQHESIVFAGDSGNDLAVLTAGFRAIVVGNADQSVAEQAQAAHRQAGWQNRLFLATAPATSGVLEGCRHFGLIDGAATEF